MINRCFAGADATIGSEYPGAFEPMNLPTTADIEFVTYKKVDRRNSANAAAPASSSLPVGDRLRVAFVITRSDSVGGASIHVRDFSRVLLEAGHQVMVFLGGEGPVTDAYHEAGIPYQTLRHLARPVSPRADFSAFWELRSAFRRYRPTLVSTHTSKAGFLGRLCAWSLGVPAVYTPHCWSFVEGFPGARLYLWAERFARPFGQRIIMVSEAERAEGLKQWVGSSDHLVTVHNGMPDVPASWRANPGLSPPHLVMIGRCERQKDHFTLLRALAQLRDLPWSLGCIGDGPLRSQIEAEVRQLNLSDRVSLLGYRDDVAEHLSRAQVFALITNWESFPRSIIEAMRAGLPVVASAVGGTAEAVDDGRTGFIVQRGDVSGLAARLRAVVADPKLRVKFGLAARRRYEAGFTLDHMVANTIKVWETVLGRPVALSHRRHQLRFAGKSQISS